MGKLTKAESIAAYNEAVRTMPPIQVTIGAGEALALIGAVQLALRHPCFPPYTAEIVRGVVDRLSAVFPEGVRNVVEMGKSPEHDVKYVPADSLAPNNN